MPLTQSLLRSLAARGAPDRIKELEAELSSIRRAFPSQNGHAVVRHYKKRATIKLKPPKRRLSAKARRQISLRMSAYWAKRRAKTSKTRSTSE